MSKIQALQELRSIITENRNIPVRWSTRHETWNSPLNLNLSKNKKRIIEKVNIVADGNGNEDVDDTIKIIKKKVKLVHHRRQLKQDCIKITIKEIQALSQRLLLLPKSCMRELFGVINRFDTTLNIMKKLNIELDVIAQCSIPLFRDLQKFIIEKKTQVTQCMNPFLLLAPGKNNYKFILLPPDSKDAQYILEQFEMIKKQKPKQPSKIDNEKLLLILKDIWNVEKNHIFRMRLTTLLSSISDNCDFDFDSGICDLDYLYKHYNAKYQSLELLINQHQQQ